MHKTRKVTESLMAINWGEASKSCWKNITITAVMLKKYSFCKCFSILVLISNFISVPWRALFVWWVLFVALLAGHRLAQFPWLGVWSGYEASSANKRFSQNWPRLRFLLKHFWFEIYVCINWFGTEIPLYFSAFESFGLLISGQCPHFIPLDSC